MAADTDRSAARRGRDARRATLATVAAVLAFAFLAADPAITTAHPVLIAVTGIVTVAAAFTDLVASRLERRRSEPTAGR